MPVSASFAPPFRRQRVGVDGFVEVLLDELPQLFHRAVAHAVFAGSKQMVDLGHGAIERNQVEIGPCTEELGFGDRTRLARRVGLDLLDDKVGLVDKGVHARIEVLYHGVVGAERIFVQLLHGGVVTSVATAGKYVVGKQVLGIEPVGVDAVPRTVERCEGLQGFLVGFVEVVLTSHVAVFRDVEIVFATDRENQHQSR